MILEHQAKAEARRQAEQEALRPWTAEEMFKIVSSKALALNPYYEFDEHVTYALKGLCLYFTLDKRFEERGYGSLDKGILLAGNVGVGKTLMMHLVSRNKRQSFEIVSCRTCSEDFMDEGIEMLYRYYGIKKALAGTFEYFLQTTLGYCFDDIGTETCPVKYMGNETNVMEKIILTRYDNKIPFHYTHFTTNLTEEEIENKYGSRAYSRLMSMVNVIELSGMDKRK